MDKKEKLLRIGFGLKLILVSTILALILGFVSFLTDSTITSSAFYLVWPVLGGILSTIIYLISRLLNKEIAFGTVVGLSLMNVFFNLVLLFL